MCVVEYVDQQSVSTATNEHKLAHHHFIITILVDSDHHTRSRGNARGKRANICILLIYTLFRPCRTETTH